MGLFVGVDEYLGLPNDRRLHGASAGACRMASYFQEADANGTWDVLIDMGKSLLVRAELLEHLVAWIPKVPSGAAGILYFAGHGVMDKVGTILCPRDYRPAIPYDSGIPLRRIFELLTEYGRPDSRYILLIDTCRSGAASQPAEYIPANVTVVYACQSGETAAESNDSSVFVDLLLTATKEIERIPKDALQYGELSTLCKLLTEGTVSVPGSRLQRCDYYGGGGAGVFLPVQEVVAALHPESAPLVRMHTRALDEASYSILMPRLVACFQEIGQSPADLDRCIQSQSLVDLLRRVTLILPPFSALYAPDAVLQLLLSRCYSMFEEISLQWPIPLADSSFRRIAWQYNPEEISVSAAELIVRWKEGIHFGQVLIAQKGSTTAGITCRAASGYPLSLEYLVPSLSRVYKALCRLHLQTV